MTFPDNVRRQVHTPAPDDTEPTPPTGGPGPGGGVSVLGVFFAVLAALWVWKHCGGAEPAAKPTPAIRSTTTRGAR